MKIISESTAIENDTVILDAPGKKSGRLMDESPDHVILDVVLRVTTVEGPYRRTQRLVKPVAVSASDIPIEWLSEEVQRKIWEGLRK